jgi:lipoprotein-releasing system permease protein
MALSAAGVIFGVGFFIAAQAQTSGFQKYFVDTTLGSSGSVVISERFQMTYSKLLDESKGDLVTVNNPQSRKYYPGIDDVYHKIDTLMEYSNVEGCSPILEDRAYIRVGFRTEAVQVYGIDLDLHLKATALGSQIMDGTVEAFRGDPSAIALGTALAEKVEAKIGQNVFLVGPNGDSRRFRVQMIYQTGINAIDEKRIYVHRRSAQSTLGQPFSTTLIVIKLKDPTRAPEDAKAFEDLLWHRSRSWQERERGNLQLLQTLQISAGVTVSTIILLAGFGIFNVLTMSVLEKTKEISILRSMGFSRRDIAKIFLWQGLGVAVGGILMGWLLGAALTVIISLVPIRLRGVIRADHLIVDWALWHYLAAAVLAAFAVLIAAYTPARRAARLEPVAILRGTSQ